MILSNKIKLSSASHRKPMNCSSPHSGLTLIELLITLLVLTIGTAAIVKFQTWYFYYSGLSRQREEALNLAETELATLRTFEVISTTSGYTAYASIASSSNASTVNGTSYTTTWTITTNTNPNYKTANVIVSWTDRNNNTQNVTLTGIIASIDPMTSGILVYG